MDFESSLKNDIRSAENSKNIGKIIKLIFDMYPNLKIFATGSVSFDLNFEEFLLWKDKSLHSIFKDNQKSVVDFIKGEKVSISEKDVLFFST